jgi:ribosomal protein S18 acetylase RimI-like enzyme
VVEISPYDAELHREGVREVLEKNGWERRYVEGQLAGLAVLSANLLPGPQGKVYVSESEGTLSGFVSVEFRQWNRLGQVHGLAVDPSLKRRGIASALIRCAERFVREEGGRGIYVDTPATNRGARGFYRALGYQHAYTMPEYYDEELHGVTYLKLFRR